MDEHSIAFLEVMIALAIVGILSFLIYLVSRQTLRATPGSRPVYQPRWYELILAAIFLAVVAIVVIWWMLSSSGDGIQINTRATTFFVIMMIIGGGAIVVFVISLFWRLSQKGQAEVSVQDPPRSQPAGDKLATHKSPTSARLIGILGFFVVFLVICWSYLMPTERHAMMLNLIYPAGLIVALVMLFDKASRSWDVKTSGESTREWLYANAMLGLYLIAFVNLLRIPNSSVYTAMFWDTLFVVSFLLVFWAVDRATVRLRFLLLHAWLIALPILLLIWQSRMGIELPADISWWDTIWPFFVLAVAFFVIELIIQISTDQGTGVSTFKDIVFLALYIILLISVRPEAVA